MNSIGHSAESTGQKILWTCLILISCGFIAALNGAPLYYFDSAGYLENGLKVLQVLGLVSDPAAAEGGAGAGHAADRIVNGSRSVVYSLFSAASAQFLGAMAIPLTHLVAVAGVIVFLMRLLVRGLALPGTPMMQVTGLSVLAASLGALPFFIAYFMPDILAGLMVLAIATLTLGWSRMGWWEVLLTLAIGCVAVLSHPSHLVIAGLMVPLVALAALLVSRRRWWVAPLLVALMPLAGVGERLAFSKVAAEQLDAKVTYFPFLTARMIEDEVGYAYLEENCPNTAIATCALYDALQLSDDPYRLTASHIIFEFSGELASFQRLHPEIQARVAAEQIRFTLWVGLSRPVGTAMVILRNTFQQARMNSIRMTIPEADIAAQIQAVEGYAAGTFPTGRLVGERDWIWQLDRAHNVYYVLCLIGLVWLMLWPGRLTREQRVLGLVVLAGILVNAFVCGAVSQPAHRYGSRMIWLLPFITMALWMMSRHNSRSRPDPA